MEGPPKVLQAFFLSIGQLGDKRIAAVFLKSFAVTLAIFAALGFGLWWLVDWAVARWLGAGDDSSSWASLVTAVIMVLSFWVLFRAIAIAVIDVFADDVVKAVEARHYPSALASARDVPFARALAMGLGSAWRTVIVNLVLSPLYLILLVTGIGTPIAFFLVNAWLLARDLGDMVAARHLPAKDMARWRGRSRLSRLSLGGASAALFLVPALNILAPVLSAAMATHMFHRRRR